MAIDEETQSGNIVVSEKRMREKADSVRSEFCSQKLAICAVCSIPRWKFARDIDPKRPDKKGYMGAIMAGRSIVEGARHIMRGKDILVEDLLSGRETGLLRAYCAKSLLAPMSYVLYFI